MASSMDDLMAGSADTPIPNKGPTLFYTVLIMPIVAAVFVIVRLASRWSKVMRFGIDDYCIMVAMALSIVVTVMDSSAIRNGFGKHAKDLTKPQLSQAMKFFYLAQPPYKAGIFFVKLSILTLYHRVFTFERFRKVNAVLLGFVISYSIAFLFVTIFQCTPIHRAWLKTIPGHCVSNFGQWYSYAIINIFSDFFIIILPMPMIRRLQLPRGQKIGLGLIFSLGAFVCVTSILRMISLQTSSQTPDPTFGSVAATMWTDIEFNTAIICACLPVLKAPLTAFFPRLFPMPANSERRTRDVQLSNIHSHKTNSHGTTTLRSSTRKTKTFVESSTEIPSSENSPRMQKEDNHCRTQSQERIMGDHHHYRRRWQSGTVLIGPDEEESEREREERGIVKTTEIGISYDDGESASARSRDEDKDSEQESRY